MRIEHCVKNSIAEIKLESKNDLYITWELCKLPKWDRYNYRNNMTLLGEYSESPCAKNRMKKLF